MAGVVHVTSAGGVGLTKSLLFLVCLCAAIVPLCHSLSCYSCNSDKSNWCTKSKDQMQNVTLDNCGSCFKNRLPSGLIIRGCSAKATDGCWTEKDRNNGRYMTWCSCSAEDRCNSGQRVGQRDRPIASIVYSIIVFLFSGHISNNISICGFMTITRINCSPVS